MKWRDSSQIKIWGITGFIFPWIQKNCSIAAIYLKFCLVIFLLILRKEYYEYLYEMTRNYFHLNLSKLRKVKFG